MKKNIVRSDERGVSQIDWLDSKFSFSFANYFNPLRMGFGKLLVFNDDIFAPKKGFDMHPHDNMEIITVITSGELKHKDSMENFVVLEKDFVQVMSAGSGLYHSEMNNSSTNNLELFQIWIEPKVRNVVPIHAEKKVTFKKNELQLIVSGNKKDNSIFIYQDAKLFLGKFDKEKFVEINTSEEKGLFIFVVEGKINASNEILNKRDCLEISEISKIKINFLEDSYILVLEVPM